MPGAAPFADCAADAVAHFDRHGWVLVRGEGSVELAAQLRAWADEVAGWPDPPAGLDPAEAWSHHREMTDAGPARCRTENMAPSHAQLDALLRGPLLAAAGALLGEPAVLYKDKLNWKAPGGAGYAPHQDAPAYPFVDRHVSCMVAVDDADTSNGCLEVVSGAHDQLWPTDDRGCIRAEVVAALHWEAVSVRAGDALWFHSRTPHRSGPNRSGRPRRALYPTYNAAAEGDLRAGYYRRRAVDLAASPAASERVLVSLIGDFEGRPIR